MSSYSGLSPLPLPNSSLLVVGGCGGIGRAVVSAAISHGVNVTVLDLPASIAANPVPASVKAIECDATNEVSVVAAFTQLADSHQQLDAMINLVGFTKEQVNIEDMPVAEWDEIVSGTLRSAFLVNRSALPLLRKSGAGAIVNTSSTFGVSVPHSGYGPYSAGKAGVINLTRALATEGAPDVRANAVAPGIVDTEFLSGGTGRAEKESRINKNAVLKGIPLRRLGRAEDMVGIMLFLCSPAAAYITAQTFHVNGGSWS